MQANFKHYHLVVLILAVALFPRVINALGAPDVVNFLHFPLVVAGVLVFSLNPRRTLSEEAFELLKRVGLLFVAITLSAVANGAGFINILLDFLLLAEPFLFLVLMINSRWDELEIKSFQFWVWIMIGIHAGFAYFQYVGMGYHDDAVKGVFLNMGAGHHIAGAVALAAAVYTFFVLPKRLIQQRILFALLLGAIVIFSDAKQVLAAFLVALIMLGFWNLTTAQKFLQYFLVVILVVGLLFLLAITIFTALGVWVTEDRLTAGFTQKFSIIPLTISYYDSFLNWLFGLGPGHTVSRLAWLTPKYTELLAPLGVTTFPLTEAAWNAQHTHWTSNPVTGSSLFSLFFSWSGIWGDLGLIGLGAYLYVWFFVWKTLCTDDLSRFLLLTVMVSGGIFVWMEEPNYMIFMMALIGSRFNRVHLNQWKQIVLISTLVAYLWRNNKLTSLELEITNWESIELKETIYGDI